MRKVHIDIEIEEVEHQVLDKDIGGDSTEQILHVIMMNLIID